MANKNKTKSKNKKTVAFKTKKGQKVNFKAKTKQPKHQFPKEPKKGQKKVVKTKHGKTTFEATGKKGFGQWKIVGNKKK